MTRARSLLAVIPSSDGFARQKTVAPCADHADLSRAPEERAWCSVTHQPENEARRAESKPKALHENQRTNEVPSGIFRAFIRYLRPLDEPRRLPLAITSPVKAGGGCSRYNAQNATPAASRPCPENQALATFAPAVVTFAPAPDKLDALKIVRIPMICCAPECSQRGLESQNATKREQLFARCSRD